MTQIFTVVSCGQVQQVPSQKTEGGFLSKRSMMLQEFGNRSATKETLGTAKKYGDQFIVSQLGSGCQVPIAAGDTVVASLRFTAREYQGQMYQDIVVNDIRKIG